MFFDDPNPLLLRQLKDQLRAGKTKGHTLAVLGCRLKLILTDTPVSVSTRSPTGFNILTTAEKP